MIRRLSPESSVPERVTMETSDWFGTVAAESGANLIRLRHKRSGLEILRTPPDDDALAREPECYGIPLLLPPNRIAGGRFIFENREYRLPLNRPRQNCHLHGLMLGRPWTLLHAAGDRHRSETVFSHDFTEQSPEYSGFPHHFRCELRYRLRPDGLTQTLRLRNTGVRTMPLGVGYHTAFNAPGNESCRIEIPYGPGRWRVHPVQRTPDGSLIPWTDAEKALWEGRRGFSGDALGVLLPLGAGRRVRLRRGGVTLDYRFDRKFGQFAVWNDNGGHDFICLEPMSWMADAPNLPLPPAVTGLRRLPPGATAVFTSRLTLCGAD